MARVLPPGWRRRESAAFIVVILKCAENGALQTQNGVATAQRLCLSAGWTGENQLLGGTSPGGVPEGCRQSASVGVQCMKRLLTAPKNG